MQEASKNSVLLGWIDGCLNGSPSVLIITILVPHVILQVII